MHPSFTDRLCRVSRISSAVNHTLPCQSLTLRHTRRPPQNQLKTSAPVSGGVGELLLKKMGWKPGQGLGKNQDGSLTPLLLDVKMDKKGLVSEDERPGGKKQAPVTLTNVKDVSGECALVAKTRNS